NQTTPSRYWKSFRSKLPGTSIVFHSLSSKEADDHDSTSPAAGNPPCSSLMALVSLVLRFSPSASIDSGIAFTTSENSLKLFMASLLIHVSTMVPPHEVLINPT